MCMCFCLVSVYESVCILYSTYSPTNPSITPYSPNPPIHQECINVAIKGLQQLEQFSNISKQGQNWTVYLEDNPMPDNRDTEEKVKFTKTD